MKLKENKKEVKPETVNEVLSLTAKILKLIYIVVIIGIVLIATLLIKEWGILTFLLTVLKVAAPLFIGFIIAWIFNPIVNKLEEKGLDRIFGTIIVFAILLFLLYLFIAALVPTLYNQINDFIKSLPDILSKIEGFVERLFNGVNSNGMFDPVEVKTNIINGIQNYMVGMTENLPETLINSIGSIFSGVGTTAISLIIGFYMLFDFNSITNHFLKLIPTKNRFEISSLVTKIGVELRKTVNGTLNCAFIVFLGATLGFWIIGLKAPVLFGLLCGITDLIPYIGPFIGGAVAVVIGFSQSVWIGILSLIVVVVIQQLENLVIQPLVMSKSTKLHPVTIIIGLLIFGHFFGIVGMIFATPVISLLKVLWRFIVEKFNLFDYPNEYELTKDEKKK